jgi:predicted nucleic acid-binding protein
MIEPAVAYLDANAFIDLFQGEDAISAPVQEIFRDARDSAVSVVTSELTLAEFLAPPRSRNGRAELTPDVKRGFLTLVDQSGLVRLDPITRSILLETANLRRVSAARKLRLPDAIHLVTAIKGEANFFVSSDHSIPMPEGMKKLDRQALAAGRPWSSRV